MEKSLWEQYNVFLKDKFGMGTEFIGETKDNKTKTSPDLSSKAVEKPVDEEKQASEPLVMIPFLEQKSTRSQMARKQIKLSSYQGFNTKANSTYKS